jgi:Mn-containing catalase
MLSKFPEVRKLLDQGLRRLQYTFSADNRSQADKLFRGASPSNDGTALKTAIMPDSVPMEIAPERREEFSPGLDAELLQMLQATLSMSCARSTSQARAERADG